MTRKGAQRNPPPVWSTMDGAPPRQHMLAAALLFVRAATRLGGVSRVALIGSLTTTKDDPKDIDVLVTVSDETDIVELDRLGRRFQGQISATACGLYGADVFLSDAAGSYLGRLCKHRECPSLRRCAARNCGVRPHLKDDLDVVTLAPVLIATPPLVLWPTVSSQSAVPLDVARYLVAPLQGQNQCATDDAGSLP